MLNINHYEKLPPQGRGALDGYLQAIGGGLLREQVGRSSVSIEIPKIAHRYKGMDVGLPFELEYHEEFDPVAIGVAKQCALAAYSELQEGNTLEASMVCPHLLIKS
jgi:hypothetical protein